MRSLGNNQKNPHPTTSNGELIMVIENYFCINKGIVISDIITSHII